MNRASKVVLLEAEVEGEASSSFANRDSLPSVSITDLFRYKDSGDAANGDSPAPSHTYSLGQAGSSRQRSSNRTSPESYEEEGVDQHTSARPTNTSRRSRDSWSRSSPQVDGLDSGRRKKSEHGRSRGGSRRNPASNACNV